MRLPGQSAQNSTFSLTDPFMFRACRAVASAKAESRVEGSAKAGKSWRWGPRMPWCQKCQKPLLIPHGARCHIPFRGMARAPIGLDDQTPYGALYGGPPIAPIRGVIKMAIVTRTLRPMEIQPHFLDARDGLPPRSSCAANIIEAMENTPLIHAAIKAISIKLKTLSTTLASARVMVNGLASVQRKQEAAAAVARFSRTVAPLKATLDTGDVMLLDCRADAHRHCIVFPREPPLNGGVDRSGVPTADALDARNKVHRQRAGPDQAKVGGVDNPRLIPHFGVIDALNNVIRQRVVQVAIRPIRVVSPIHFPGTAVSLNGLNPDCYLTRLAQARSAPGTIRWRRPSEIGIPAPIAIEEAGSIPKNRVKADNSNTPRKQAKQITSIDAIIGGRTVEVRPSTFLHWVPADPSQRFRKVGGVSIPTWLTTGS